MNRPKSTTLVFILSAAALVFFSADSFAAQEAKHDTETASKNVKRETMEAIQAIKKYSVKQKDKAVGKVEFLIEDMDIRIDRMQRRVDDRWDQMDKASREKARKTLAALRKMRNNISEWYGGLKHSSTSAWDQVKNGFVEGYEALSEAFEKAENEFSAPGQGKSPAKE